MNTFPGAIWMLQGPLEWPFKLSRQGGDSGQILSSDIEPEDIDRVLTTVRERLATRRELLMALEKDESAFLPASFLEVATQRSTAVCRIARYFSVHSFKAVICDLISDSKVISAEMRRLIQNIDQLQANEKKQFLIILLKEIFSIPDEISEKIFYDAKSQQHEQDLQLESLLEELLEDLQDISPAQLSKLNPIAIGTGFLVGGAHLMTNNHVVPTASEARECVAQFNYVQDALGGVRTIIEYEFDPELLFVSNSSLDYTLVQLKAGLLKKQPGYTFGWIQLTEDNENILPAIKSETIENLQAENPEIQNPFKDSVLNPEEKIKKLSGDRVFIIQHPRGERQKIAQSDNEVLPYKILPSDSEFVPDFIGGLLKNYIRYTTASDFGSSGAPVLNDKGELVALNHAVIKSGIECSEHKFVCQGVRICRIIDDLKKKSIYNSKLLSWVQDFVITSEQFKYPPLPAALNFDGSKNFIRIESQKLSDSKAFSIEAWINFTGQQDKSTIFTAFCKEGWAEKESTLDDVILQCYVTLKGELVVARKKPFNAYPSSSILYPSSRLALFYPKRYSLGSSLRPGEKSTRVIEFKKFLKLIPNLSISLENTVFFSDRDSDQIKEFQKNNFDQKNKSLVVDGIVGPKTLEALWRSVQFEKIDIAHPAIGDIKYLLTLVNNGLQKPFSDSILESLQLTDNVFCENTQAAVENFRKNRKLETGIIDSTFLDALWFYGLYLRKGNKGSGVKDLQLLLKGIGYDTPDSGEFDERTESLVRQYQSDQRLDSDGIVGLRTLNSLFRERTYCYELRAQNFDSFVTKEFIEKIKLDCTLDSSNNDSTSDKNDTLFNLKIKEKLAEETNLNLGMQNHIAITYGDKMIRLLVNGRELCFSNPNNADSSKRNDDLKLGSNPACLLIGVYAETPEQIDNNYGYYFQGSLAELKLWNCNRAKSIEKDLESGKFYKRSSRAIDKSNLIGYWRFEEAEIFEKVDASNQGNQQRTTNQFESKIIPSKTADRELIALLHGVPHSVLTTQFPALPLPFGVQFKDKNDFIEIRNSRFHKLEQDLVTIEAWVQYTFGDGYILYQKSDRDGLFLGFKNGRIFVEFKEQCKETRVETEASFPNDGVWHHVAITLTSESEIWIYLDGHIQPISVVKSDKVESIVVQDRRLTIVRFQGKIDIENCPLYIGKREREKNYFHIAVSEIRLWKIARTQQDIKKFQFCRLKGDEEGLVGYWRLDNGDCNDLVEGFTKMRRE